MKPWQQKAHDVIAKMCLEAWRAVNVKKNGTRYRGHRPYTVPVDAQALVEALKNDDEITAKCIFQRHAFGIIHK